jgi:predicted homoserine dehydrogenase-like protein
MGTYVVFEAAEDNEYSRRCFREYSMLPDSTGRYAALYRPIHMIGLELGLSVASAALRKEPTGAPICFNSDVVATAKRKLRRARSSTAKAGSASGASRPQRRPHSTKAICRSASRMRSS